jgi:hypothetical protein
MAKKITVKVEIRLAWWFEPYAYSVAFICALFGREPDMARVGVWINRALKCRVVG